MPRPTPTIVVKSTQVLRGDTLEPACVVVRDGTIVEVADYNRRLRRGERLLDVSDDVVMPGVVDSHVHVSEDVAGDGSTAFLADGFEAVSKAAAAGGLTTIVDMPLNSRPVVTTLEALKKKQAICAKKAYLYSDVALLGGVVPGNIDELAPMIENGVVGFKCFTCHSGLDDFQGCDEMTIRAALQRLKDTGTDPLLMFHAEHAETLAEAEEKANLRRLDDPNLDMKYSVFLESRPPVAEDKAIEMVIRLCEEFDVRCHIVHLSSANAVQAVREARDRGVRISAETTAHYLFFAAEEIPDGNTLYKCCPPIRESENRSKLWQALKDGVIEQVVSDHSPCHPDLKCLDSGKFSKAWGGISSLQLTLPVVWTAARDHGCTVADIARWMSLNTARLVKLDAKKGSIEPGKDADLCIWRPDEVFTVDEHELHFTHKKTPYHGYELNGVVTHTMLRGQIIYEKGHLHQPIGELVTPDNTAPHIA